MYDAQQATATPGTIWTSRLLPLLAAALCVLGSVLFLGGGRLHPAIGGGLDATPGDFFLAFAEKVRHTDGWQRMHMMILLGPLCWAIGAPALMDVLRPDARPIVSTARAALLLAGGLWAVAFALDGFGAPVYAEALVASAPEAEAGVLASFAANAVVMSRLGLVSWVVGGLGIVVLGSLLLARPVRTPWRFVVGVTGVLLGAWPLVAALEGEYAAGPFTSSFWMLNALTVGLWFMALATCAFRRRAGRAGASPRP